MGVNSSEFLEEILHKCYELKIIDKVRQEVKQILLSNSNITLLEAYETVFLKYENSVLKNDDV